jgi:hypothetical protein
MVSFMPIREEAERKMSVSVWRLRKNILHLPEIEFHSSNP